MSVGLALFVAACTAAVLASSARAAATFGTHGRAAYCAEGEGEEPTFLVCWRPKDGFTLSMGYRDRPAKEFNPANRGLYAIALKTLGFGDRYTWPHKWTCVSRRTGLTCTNQAGHGWWLGRSRGHRLF